MKRVCDEGIWARYEWVKLNMPRYLAEHGLTHLYLGRKTGFARSTVTKFLDGYPGFYPKPGNRLMVLLTKLEAILQCNLLLAYLPLALPDMDPIDDDFLAAYHHHEALDRLVKSSDYRNALRLVAPLCAIAIRMDPRFRASACVFNALAIEVWLAWPEIRPLAPDVLRDTLKRVEALRRAARASSKKALNASTREDACAKADAYGGAGISYIGHYRNDATQILRGVRMQLRAAPLQQRLEQGFWHNLFQFATVLLREDSPVAQRVADLVGEAAHRHWNKIVEETMLTHVYPELWTFWNSAGAAVATRLPKK